MVLPLFFAYVYELRLDSHLCRSSDFSLHSLTDPFFFRTFLSDDYDHLIAALQCFQACSYSVVAILGIVVIQESWPVKMRRDWYVSSFVHLPACFHGVPDVLLQFHFVFALYLLQT